MSSTSSSEGTAIAQEYYSSFEEIDVSREFCCLDEPSNLEQLMQAVRSNTTKNWVLDFSDITAYTGIDITSDGVGALIEAERPACLGTRWINIWYPSKQTKLLEVLARHYDFSPRLLALMCSDPKQPRDSGSRTSLIRSVHKRTPLGRKVVSFEVNSTDSCDTDELSVHSSTSSRGSMMEGNHYKIASDIWHYSSIDLGRRYVCVGFNSLYGTHGASSKDTSSNPTANAESEQLLPHCTRVWMWLLVTTDQTVISITEDPFPYTDSASHTALEKRILMETRRNPINIFRSLSAVHEPLLTHNPLTLLPIRTRLGSTPEETAHRSSDAPGLLFYYLFENFKNSYTLITRKENRYGMELANLRKSMVEQPTLQHIDRLDKIGNELGVLRRHYNAYLRLIDRLLEPQGSTLASLQNSQVINSNDSDSISTVRPRTNAVLVREEESMIGVSLSSAALVRFRRLRDLIDLYALKEVEEYIKQKESLVAMNLSLITIQQSLDVERLTKVALLLTKATILFLPASFMTGYFSVPLDNIEYSLITYWVAFAVIFLCSYVGLFMFGAFNNSLQTPNFVYGALEVVEQVWSTITRKKSGAETELQIASEKMASA